MNTDDLDAMKYDRRMRFRRGWVKDSEVNDYLEGLPDVASKAGEAEPAREPEAAPPPPPEPVAAAAPVAPPEPAPVETPGVAAFGALPDDPTSIG